MPAFQIRRAETTEKHLENPQPTLPNTTALSPERCRTRDIAGVGLVEVPRHIVRLQGRGLRGWQVRFTKPWRYFVDAPADSPRESALASLEEAKQHLVLIWTPQAKKRVKRKGPGRAGNAVPGVWLTSEPRPPYTVWYMVAGHPSGGNRRFYIGTNGTFSQARHRVAERRALAQREAWLEEVEPRYR